MNFFFLGLPLPQQKQKRDHFCQVSGFSPLTLGQNFMQKGVFYPQSPLFCDLLLFSPKREVPFCPVSNLQIEMPFVSGIFISGFVSNIFISLKYMLFFYFWRKLLWMGIICIVYILMVSLLEYLSLQILLETRAAANLCKASTSDIFSHLLQLP